MFYVKFTYADYRIKGYERFGAEKHIQAQFNTKHEAWNWMRKVEKHAEANAKVSLDNVMVWQDENLAYNADYNRQQFVDLYDHVDCHGGIWRFIR